MCDSFSFFRMSQWIRSVVVKLSNHYLKILCVDAHKYQKNPNKQSSFDLKDCDCIYGEFSLKILNTTEQNVIINEAFITLKDVQIAKKTYTELDYVYLSGKGLGDTYKISPLETKEIAFRFSQMDGKQIDGKWINDKRCWRLKQSAWKSLWYYFRNPLKIVLVTNLGKFEHSLPWAVFTEVYKKGEKND